MAKFELLRVSDKLYCVIRKFPIHTFKQPLTAESADILKKWFHCDTLLISKNTNEYIFVNNVDDAKIID
jgi:hypothetical protein